MQDRHEMLALEFANTKESGSVHSSRFRVVTKGLVQREYRLRAQLAWQAWEGALATQRAVPLADLRDTLVAEVERCLEVDSQDVPAVYFEAIHLSNSSGLDPHQELQQLRSEARERAASLIDYAILAATAQQPADAKEVTFHFHGPVGAVQTGPAATASVVQHFGPTERAAVLDALAAVESEALAALPDADRAQVVEVMADVRAEAKKDRPNALRLRGGLSAIATTIQTLGAAPAVYGLLKGAAALLGMHLP